MTVRFVSWEVIGQMQFNGMWLHSSSGRSSKCVIELSSFLGIKCLREFILMPQSGLSKNIGSSLGQLRVN